MMFTLFFFHIYINLAYLIWVIFEWKCVNLTFFYYKPPDVYFFWGGVGWGGSGGGGVSMLIWLIPKITAILCSFEIEIMCNILSIQWLKLSVEKMPKIENWKKKKTLKSYYWIKIKKN